jgi:hypothetical protein
VITVLVLGIFVALLLNVGSLWIRIPTSTLVVSLAAVWAIGLLIPAAERIGDPRLPWGDLLTGAAAGLLCAWPMAVNSNVRVYGDALFHGQIVQELLHHGLPPQDPSYAGQQLAYVWPFHAWAASISRLSGADPYAVAAWYAGMCGFALAVVFLSHARAYTSSSSIARLSLIVFLCGMNALGIFQAALRLGLSPLVGSNRGGTGLVDWMVMCFDRPNAGAVANSLIYRGHFVLSSFLYKLVCVNSVGVGLVLAATSGVTAVLALRTGSVRTRILLLLSTWVGCLAHPVVGLVSIVAIAGGMVASLSMREVRRPAAWALAAVLAAGWLAAPLLNEMLTSPLESGARAKLHFHLRNVPALVQCLAVTAPLAVLGIRHAWPTHASLVLFSVAYLLMASTMSLAVEFPSDAFAYPVYVAYLGTVWLIPTSIEAWTRRAAAKRKWRTLGVIGLCLLPGSTLLLVQGFVRHDARWGLAGYPETADEIAVFERLKETPEESLVIDTQNFQMSAAAGYSARRSVFGGMTQVGLLGYPAEMMRQREAAIRDLMFAPSTSDSTWSVLNGFRGPLYVVARRAPSGGRVFDAVESPTVNPILKLDADEKHFERVVHTESIALYRYLPDH